MAEQFGEKRVRVTYHDGLTLRYRTLVIGPDHESSGAEHPDCDQLAMVCPDLDSAFCSACHWQARISGAWYVDITQAVWHGAAEQRHERAWRIPTADGSDYGVLVEMEHEHSRHWFLLCPATATLYLYDHQTGEIDLTDCCDGEGCDFLDDVHAGAHVLVRQLDLLRESQSGGSNS